MGEFFKKALARGLTLGNIASWCSLEVMRRFGVFFGTLRLRRSGSDGGHNGLSNIQEMLESQDWARLRVGIGHDFTQGRQIDYVLGDFPEEERNLIPEIAKTIISGVRTWCFVGIDKAMNQLNTKQKSE